MKPVAWTALACLILATSGCFPQRVVWAPNGEVAAVIGSEGLYLCDPNGRLSKPLEGKFAMVAWFPDSRRLLTVRHSGLATWKELDPYVPPEHKKGLDDLAQRLRQEIMAHEGEWAKFRWQTVSGLNSRDTLAVKLCLRDVHGQGLSEKMGPDWEKMAKETCLGVTIGIAARDKDELKPGPAVLRTLDEILEVRVSPTGKSLAYVRGDADKWYERSLSLWVSPAEANAPVRPVADDVAFYPDWSPDGRALVYAAAATPRANMQDKLRLGTITRREVCGADGALLEQFGAAEDLAGIMFNMIGVRVRCLADGRILFSSNDLTLPATAGDMPETMSLFALDPARQATVVRVTPRSAESALAKQMHYFEVSPDGKLLVTCGENGAITLMTLATGQVTLRQPEGTKRLQCPPSWRAPDVLCFAVYPGSSLGSATRPEVVMCQAGTFRCISKDWPDSVLKDFFEN